MKIRSLQLIDQYIGGLLCALCAPLQRHAGAADRPGASAVSSILIIKFWGMGSIVLAYDFFRALRQRYPGARLCALTLSQNEEVFRISGLFDEISTLDGKLLFRNTALFALRFIRTILRLRRRFDLAFDLEFTTRSSALITWFIAAPRRLGFSYTGVWRGNNYTTTVAFQEDAPLADSYGKLLTAIEPAAPSSPPFSLHLPPEAAAETENILARLGASGREPLVGMNINASDLCLLRRWPQEHFVALAQHLVETYAAQILFIGNAQDRSYIEETRALAAAHLQKSLYNTAGLFSITNLFALMKRLRLFISNDSGPLHVAVFCGVPTISFFGPETPAIYGPRGEPHLVYYTPMPCSPCIRVKNYKYAVCQNNQQCLRSITPQKVWDDLERTGTLRPYRR